MFFLNVIYVVCREFELFWYKNKKKRYSEDICLTFFLCLVCLQKKELAALETELQSKVKYLNEHQTKVDEIEEELLEMAENQKQMLNLEVS